MRRCCINGQHTFITSIYKIKYTLENADMCFHACNNQNRFFRHLFSKIGFKIAKAGKTGFCKDTRFDGTRVYNFGNGWANFFSTMFTNDDWNIKNRRPLYELNDGVETHLRFFNCWRQLLLNINDQQNIIFVHEKTSIFLIQLIFKYSYYHTHKAFNSRANSLYLKRPP